MKKKGVARVAVGCFPPSFFQNSIQTSAKRQKKKVMGFCPHGSLECGQEGGVNGEVDEGRGGMKGVKKKQKTF